MTSLNAQQEDSLTAFMTALSQQQDALPPTLQAQLKAIGQNLENRVMELPAIAASLPSLNQAYQAALKDERATPEAEQEHGSELLAHAARILTQADPVKTAQADHAEASSPTGSSLLKRLFRRG